MGKRASRARTSETESRTDHICLSSSHPLRAWVFFSCFSLIKSCGCRGIQTGTDTHAHQPCDDAPHTYTHTHHFDQLDGDPAAAAAMIRVHRQQTHTHGRAPAIVFDIIWAFLSDRCVRLFHRLNSPIRSSIYFSPVAVCAQAAHIPPHRRHSHTRTRTYAVPCRTATARFVEKPEANTSSRRIQDARHHITMCFGRINSCGVFSIVSWVIWCTWWLLHVVRPSKSKTFFQKKFVFFSLLLLQISRVSSSSSSSLLFCPCVCALHASVFNSTRHEFRFTQNNKKNEPRIDRRKLALVRINLERKLILSSFLLVSIALKFWTNVNASINPRHAA